MDDIVSSMDVSRPYAAVCSTVDGDVLHVLAGTSQSMTGREVAAKTGRRSHAGVLDALHRLTTHGLVNRVQLNHAYLFTLNRDHLAAEAVVLLMNMRAKLFENIRDEIATWGIPPVHASMFGPTARGDGDATSDIAMLIVRPPQVTQDDARWQAQLEFLRKRVEAWTGNHAAIKDRSETELADLQVRERPIIDDLRSDAIVLYGKHIAAFLGSS